MFIKHIAFIQHKTQAKLNLRMIRVFGPFLPTFAGSPLFQQVVEPQIVNIRGGQADPFINIFK
jgi:hypothetical protein